MTSLILEKRAGGEMIDIHSHLIYGVDGGTTDADEAVKMIWEAQKLGIKAIIATPQLMNAKTEISKIIENFERLKLIASECDVTLKLGFHVSLNSFSADMIYGGNSLSLNNSRYILIEPPDDIISRNFYDDIYWLQLQGLLPIIAYPEKNKSFLKNFKLLMGLISRGCMIQIDAASIAGFNGFWVREFAKKMIRSNMVHFIGSNAHRACDYADRYMKAYRNTMRWGGEEYADKLFNKNPKLILDNEYKGIYEMI